MAIADGKKRVRLALDDETLKKLEELYEHEKEHNRGFGQFTNSNVIKKLIDDRHEILKKFGE